MIPKIIHYCWIGGKPLPESAKKCIRSWKKYCPDYQIIEWNETNYDFTKQPYMKQALEAKKWGFVPDYARLDIIYTYGGIYLDTDVEMVRPFDELLQYKGFAGFETEDHVALGLGFGAEAGNPLIKTLIDSYDTLSFINSDGSLNMVASPQLNTRELIRLGLKTGAREQTLDGFVFLPMEYLCPKSFEDGILRITDKTLSIHHYDSSWYTETQQAEKKERWNEYKKREQIKEKKAKKKRIRHRIAVVAKRIFGQKFIEKIKGGK